LSVYEGPSGYELADWRRQINDLYASVRAIEDPVAGWWLWHETRTDLFREHPVSPIAESERESFGGIPVFNYDSSLRFEVKLDAVLGDALSVDLARDGTMTYRPIAQTLGLSHEVVEIKMCREVGDGEGQLQTRPAPQFVPIGTGCTADTGEGEPCVQSSGEQRQIAAKGVSRNSDAACARKLLDRISG